MLNTAVFGAIGQFPLTAVLKKKYELQTKVTQQRKYWQIWGDVTVLKFPLTFALDFPYICLQFFPGNFSSNEEKFSQTNVLKILKSG